LEQFVVRHSVRVKVLCVKVGKKYSVDYVYRLRNMVRRHLLCEHEFICLTDKQIAGVSCVPCDKPKWWGKVDVFSYEGPCIYFDLDTIIINDITPIAEEVQESDGRVLYMLRPFRRAGWASGVMAWMGSLKAIQSGFRERYIDLFSWDQKYIAHMAKRLRIPMKPIQSLINVYSYKRHCRGEGLPDDATIVCFHGSPLPHEVDDEWVKEYWR